MELFSIYWTNCRRANKFYCRFRDLFSGYKSITCPVMLPYTWAGVFSIGKRKFQGRRCFLAISSTFITVPNQLPFKVLFSIHA